MRSLRPLSVGTCRGSHWKIFQWVSLVEERRIALCDVVPQPREKVSTSIRRTRLLPLVFHLILVQRMPDMLIFDQPNFWPMPFNSVCNRRSTAKPWKCCARPLLNPFGRTTETNGVERNSCGRPGGRPVSHGKAEGRVGAPAPTCAALLLGYCLPDHSHGTDIVLTSANHRGLLYGRKIRVSSSF